MVMRIALYWRKLRVLARSSWKKRSKEWMAVSKVIQKRRSWSVQEVTCAI